MSLKDVSDEELKKLASGGGNSLSGMSDDELKKLAGGSDNTGPQIVEEMHDSFSWGDRAAVKNFSTDTDKSVAYLQNEHPDMEIKNHEGRVLARGKGEKEFRVLDPDTGFFSSDFLHDATDIAYDTVAGVGEGVAATAAGLSSGGLAAIPAGMATAAGSEVLRQGIGAGLGIQDDLGDAAKEVALSSVMGGVFPAAGVGAKQAWRGVKAAAPTVGSFLTGASKKTMKALGGRHKELDNISNNFASSIDDLTEGVQGLVKEQEEGIFKGVKESMGPMDISALPKALDDKIDEQITKMVDNDHFMNKNNLQLLESLETLKLDFFQNKPFSEFKSVDPEFALELKATFKDIGQIDKLSLAGMSQKERALVREAKELGAIATKTINESSKAYGAAAKEFGDKHYANNLLKKVFADPTKTYNTIRGLDKPNRRLVREALEVLKRSDDKGSVAKALDIEKKIELMELEIGFGDVSGSGLVEAVQQMNSPAQDGLGSVGAIIANTISPSYAAVKAGAYAGKALGKTLGAPKNIRKIIRAAPELEKGARKFSPWVLGGGRTVQRVNDRDE